MSRPPTARRRPPWVRTGDDAGMTLIEVLVTMTIMSSVMIIFTTGIIQMYRVANKSESVSLSHTQVSLVFQRLDKELRYADGIGLEYAAQGDFYVEYRFFDYLTGDTATRRCAQLKLETATRQLKHRSWPADGTPDTVWSRLASDVSAAAQPFRLYETDPEATIGFQRLGVKVVVDIGANAQKTSTSTEVIFTALNSNRDTESDQVCVEGRVAP